MFCLCGQARQGQQMFCACGRKLGPTGQFAAVRFSGDEDRARALAEMTRTVDAGRAEFDRDLAAGFEREVYEHYRGAI